jgi:mRNA degradation ribonuclease J1/J2
VALGGLGEIGMNAYLYGYGPEDARRWLMVDCGITFPEGENDPGIDVIMPDVRFIEENRADLAGIVLTHAHEDHIGAVIELWPRLKHRSTTPFTAGMLKSAGRAARPADTDPRLRSFHVQRSLLNRAGSLAHQIRNERADPHAARHGLPHRRLEARRHAALGCAARRRASG